LFCFRQIVLVDHPQAFTFDPDDEFSLYIWQYKGSETSLRIMSFGLVALSAGLCMIKIWPLWLKILVYWTSLTLLVTLTSLIAIRLVIFAIMWTLGFRGVWLFPNLLSDDVSPLELFRPVFGTGDPKDDKKAGLTWDFGVINLLVILGMGGWFCWYIGMFESQHIPDFIVEQQELFRRYPALAPPSYDATASTTSTSSESIVENVETTLKHAAEKAFHVAHDAVEVVADSIKQIASDDDMIATGSDAADDDVVEGGNIASDLPPNNAFAKVFT
jgi:hypothetical protein